MTTPRPALLVDRARVIDTLIEAFFEDPVTAWVFEDPEVRRRVLPGWFAAMLEMVPDGGSVEVHADIAAAAVWHPPRTGAGHETAESDGLPPIARVVVDALGEDEGYQKLIALAPITEGHPDEPHWYLALLGAHPRVQGQGRGGELLARRLAVCDTEGLAAYLESSNPRNVPFYARHGFEVTDTIRLAGDGPEVAYMLRPPRS